MLVATIGRAWRVARSEGLVSFWFKLLSALGYRRLLLFERKVDESGLPPSLPPGVSFQVLTADQLSDYLLFRPEVSAVDIQRRFQWGHLCLVARTADQLLSATWVALDQARIDYVQWRLPLAPDEAYVYDAYTLKAWRGTGLSSAVSAFMSWQLQRRGATRSWRAVMPENAAAIAMQTKLGSRKVWLLKSLRLGPWQWMGRSACGR